MNHIVVRIACVVTARLVVERWDGLAALLRARDVTGHSVVAGVTDCAVRLDLRFPPEDELQITKMLG